MALAIVLSEYGSRNPLTIDPADITLATLVDLPALKTTTGIYGCSFTQTSTGLTVNVFGRATDVRAQINAALNTALGQGQGISYNPVITSSGAGVIALVGTFFAVVARRATTGSVVMVRGTFHFTRAAAGVAETLTISLPPGAGTPAVNFAAASDATGEAQMSGLHAATDFCGTLAANVGAKTVSVAVTDNAASSDVSVFFSYIV